VNTGGRDAGSALGGARRAIALPGLALVAMAACAAHPAAPEPSRCPDRAVVLARHADVARLAGCATLPGLTVRSGAALDLSALRALTAIPGDLAIGPTVAVDDVELPALRTVGGAIRVVGNGLLRRLRLPALEQAGQVVIDGNAVVTTIALPRLGAVHGALRITDNAALELIDLAALVTVDRELMLAGVPGLTLIEAERLQHAGAVTIEAPRLSPDVVERLRAAAR
jgi:hypothetical protein